jgi:hypothetical protein
MSHRFPPLRSQDELSGTARATGRTLPLPAHVDLTLLAAFAFVAAIALI